MTKIIAHRGLLYGPNIEKENTMESIHECLNLGYDVEIDVWYLKPSLYLGHDEPNLNRVITPNFLRENRHKLFIHCKNLQAAWQLSFLDDLHYFYHENDAATLTSKALLWVHPKSPFIPDGSIGVLPEIADVSYSFRKLEGICTDYSAIIKYGEIEDSWQLKKQIGK